MRTYSLIALHALASACSGSSVAPSADGGVSDAPVGMPDAVVPTPDAGWLADARIPGPDAFIDTDSGADGGPLCTCEPASDCELATCGSGTCVRTPVTDGTVCATGICVSGSCVPRGCGDGYREPGPDPAREACDDGNTLDGDACSASCVPTPFVVGARMDEDAWPDGPASSVAVDGLGNVLVLFRVTDPTGGSLVAASRLSPTGALLDPLEAPIELGGYAAAGRTHYASVAGLSGGGWAVAYDELKGDGNLMGIVVRLVQPDGTVPAEETVSAPIVANEVRRLDQTQPVVASYLDGFVVAWSDYSDAPMPVSRVRLRRFDAMGRPLTGDLLVSPDRLQQNGPAVLAASGDTLAVAFYHPAPEVNDSPAVHLRRFRGIAFVDATDIVLIPALAFDPALAPLASGASGELALVWRDLTPASMDELAGLRLPASGPVPMGTPEHLTMSPVASLAPAVAALTGSDYLVVHSVDRLRRGLGIQLSPGAPTPPELDTLRARLVGNTIGDASVARGPHGIWLVWSEVPAGRRDRIVLAYLLPVDGGAP